MYDPGGTVGRIYKEDHYTLLHTKYESYGSCGFGEEDFFYVFPIVSLLELLTPGVGPFLPQGLDSQDLCKYPGSQAPFWGEEVTSPAIVGLNTILVRRCHPIEGLGGLLTKFFWRDG